MFLYIEIEVICMIVKFRKKELFECSDVFGYLFFIGLFVLMFMFFHQFDEEKDVCYVNNGGVISVEDVSFCLENSQDPQLLNTYENKTNGINRIVLQ